MEGLIIVICSCPVLPVPCQTPASASEATGNPRKTRLCPTSLLTTVFLLSTPIARPLPPLHFPFGSARTRSRIDRPIPRICCCPLRRFFGECSLGVPREEDVRNHRRLAPAGHFLRRAWTRGRGSPGRMNPPAARRKATRLIEQHPHTGTGCLLKQADEPLHIP